MSNEETFYTDEESVDVRDTISTATPEEAEQKLLAKDYPPPPPFVMAERLMNLAGKGKTPRWYLPVADRIVWLRNAHKDAQITTEELEHSHEIGMDTDVYDKETRTFIKVFVKGYARYRAKIVIPSTGAIAPGTKTEYRATFDDYCEKAETGSIGRACLFLGFGTRLAVNEIDEGISKGRLADSPVEARGNNNRSAAANNRQPAGNPPPPPPPPPVVPPAAPVPAAPVVEEKPKLPPPPPPTGGGVPRPAAPTPVVVASTPTVVTPPPPPPASTPTPKVPPVAAPPAVRPTPAAAPPAVKSVPARASALTVPTVLPNLTNEPDEDSSFKTLTSYQRASLLSFIGQQEYATFPIPEQDEIEAINRYGDWIEWTKQMSSQYLQDEIFRIAKHELNEVTNVKNFMKWNWKNAEGNPATASAQLTVAQAQEFIFILKQVKLLYAFAIKAQGDPNFKILKQFIPAVSPELPETVRNMFYMFRTNIFEAEAEQKNFNMRLYLHKLLASTDFSKLSPEELAQYHAMKAEVANALHSADKAA